MRTLIGLLLVSAGLAGASQFVFLDDIITFTKNGYDYPDQLGPTNWVSPVNYRDGSIYVRYEPISKPSSLETGVQLCFWQDSYTLETCASCKRYTDEGVYYFNWGTPSSWWKNGGNPLDWTRAFQVMYLMHKDACGSLLMSGSCGTACYTGTEEELDNHVPITFKVLGVAVSKGGTFTEPEGWRTPFSVAAPVFDPPAGAYPDTGKLYIRLTSATPDARIYFTYYDETPTVASRTYSDSLRVPITRTIKAVAYKYCSYSAVTEAVYTISSGVADGLPVYRDVLGITPHPVTGVATISQPELLDGPFRFTLFDYTGRQVLQTDTSRFDMTGLTDGLYLYKLTTKTGMYTGKLIKQ